MGKHENVPGKQGTGSLQGWVLGGGVEHYITSNLSLKAEYLHFDFDTEEGSQTNISDVSSPIGYVFRNWHDVEIDTVKVGLNYHFGGYDRVVPLK